MAGMPRCGVRDRRFAQLLQKDAADGAARRPYQARLRGAQKWL